MNQKDYKEIAKIIDSLGVTIKGDNWVVNKIDLVKKLVDYFEKEHKFGEVFPKDKTFNKKQFLKDCGVTK